MGLIQTILVIGLSCSPLFGYFGDRYSRKWIVAIGMTTSLLAVFIGSFMESYAGFLVMRLIVGIGQSSFATVAPTIISDMFVKELRSKMLALFYLAMPVGRCSYYLMIL